MPFEFGGLVDALNPLLQAGIGYVQQANAMKQAKKLAKIQASAGALGYGAPMNFPQLGTGNMGFNLGEILPAIPGLGVNAPVQTVTSSTVGGMLSSRYPREVTYGDRVYVSRGRALLYSGDLAACKRVRKIAARARRAQGGHRPR